MASRRKGTQLGGADRQQRSVGNVSGLASCQVWEAGSGHCGESSKHLRKFRVGTLNVNTLRRRVCEVVETLSRRKVGLLHSGDQIPWFLFVCVEVLRPSQPNGVMSSVVSLPNHTFTGQA